MLKRLTQRELLEQVAADWQPQIRASWVEAINGINSRILMRTIQELLRDGDIASVVRYLDIQGDDFGRFELAMVQAYNAGGMATVDTMPIVRDPNGGRVVFSWGVRNTSAEQAMRDYAARMVTAIVDEARSGIAEVLTENLERGQSPYNAARMLAGRISRASGRREGGLIGLSRPQMKTVANIELAMRNGDIEYMREYLTFANRDKRMDSTVRRAIREQRALTAEQADRLVRLYSNKATKYRADVIAINETHQALARSKIDAFQQQIDAGKLDRQDVVKKWRRTISREPRIEHLAMTRLPAIPFDQKFELEPGLFCDGPHDPSLPARHTINCKCLLDISVDFTGRELRRYQGRIGGR